MEENKIITHPALPDGVEIRNVAFKVSSNDEKRTIEGYAALIGVESDGLGWLREIIEPGAFDGVIAKSDIKALLNHDERRGLLARYRKSSSKNSLTVNADAKGLKFGFESPKTALGEEVLENVRRGDVDECSFAFTVESDKWEKISESPEVWKRTIHKFKQIFDVSLVYDAAYSKTSVNLRGKEEAEAQLKAELEKRQKEVDEKQAEEQRTEEERIESERLAEEQRQKEEKDKEEARKAESKAYYAALEKRFLNK